MVPKPPGTPLKKSTVQTLPGHLFKESFGPFLSLLNEHDVKYQMRDVRAGVPMAASGVIEIVQAVGIATIWPALATVVVAFVNSRRGRKVIITMKDKLWWLDLSCYDPAIANLKAERDRPRRAVPTTAPRDRSSSSWQQASLCFDRGLAHQFPDFIDLTYSP